MSELWAVVLILGAAGWIISTIMFILKAFPGKGDFVASKGITWGSASLLSFLVWIIGMLND